MDNSKAVWEIQKSLRYADSRFVIPGCSEESRPGFCEPRASLVQREVARQSRDGGIAVTTTEKQFGSRV